MGYHLSLARGIGWRGGEGGATWRSRILDEFVAVDRIGVALGLAGSAKIFENIYSQMMLYSAPAPLSTSTQASRQDFVILRDKKFWASVVRHIQELRH
jgi:hypothetical protein